MDCCQLEDNSHNVKREEAGGNDPENGSPDADRGGEYQLFIRWGDQIVYSCIFVIK